MRVHPFLASLLFVGFIVGFTTITACAPAPKNPALPVQPGTPTMKPDSVSSAHVGMAALVEISHIERVLKPFNGIGAATAARVDANGKACTKTEATNLAQWETTWRCNVDPKVPGRKEILGVERLNYDQATRTLKYDAKFETRTFNDLEPRAQAHTLIMGRKIRIRFDRGATSASSRATVAMSSTVTVSSADGAMVPGSIYQTSFDGVLHGQGNDWTLGNDTLIKFDGALYGLDGERKTLWASGTFLFVPESHIKLAGLADASCTKPVGNWRVSATGAGNKLDTTMQTSETGGVVVDGSLLGWPAEHCNQP